MPWSAADAAEFGSRPQALAHEFHKAPVFQIETLARLIEETPRNRYHVNIAGQGEGRACWREGDIGGLAGGQVIEAVAKGKIWVHLQRVQDLSPSFRDLLEDVFASIEATVPGLKTYRRSMSVLISSPKMNVTYHADIPGQMLWQVKGRKRVWVYPASAPFLPQTAIENIILKRSADTDLPYEPAFDEAAAVFDLEPGLMASWPLNCPHRVVNEDCINISFTTEHWTDDLRAHYAVNYANGLLRSATGRERLSQATRGPAYWGKLALAAAHKASRPKSQKELKLKIDFRVDPTAPGGVSSITPFELVR
jgi:hypothetical protein